MELTMNRSWLRAGKWMGLKLGLGLCLLGLALGTLANAQAPSTTTVQGTVYLANGHAGSGTLRVSWPSFTTAGGQAVAADSTTVTIAPDGFVSVNLVPNLGSAPVGLYYTAVYYLSDGTTNTQYWVVPAAAEASLAQVQAQLMPAAQAVQAVDKAYVDQAIAGVSTSQLGASGGTLSGPLYLSGDPTQPLQAADKHYVDTTFSQAVPLSGGNMTGALVTPSVNGVESPVAGSAQPTLQTAIAAAASSGAVEIPPAYAGTDGFTNPNGVYVNDLRPNRAQQIERSVKEFGAVCDGVTDDTNALQSALNYAQAHGVSLTIPQGTCKTRSLSWLGQSIGGLGKQVSALMGFPGQDVLATGTDTVNMLSYTRIHDLTIYVDQSLDISCSAAEGRAPAGSCGASRLVERNSIFSPGGSGLTGSVGTGAGWAVGNCAIAMPAALGTGGNGLRVAEIENLEIVATGVDPMAAQYPGAHSTHSCGFYLAQWPQWSEFRNIDMRGLNTGIAIPALPVTTPAGLNSDSNRWQNITIQATHGFTAAAGSNNVLDNVVAEVGNSAATGEPPTGLVLDLSGTQQGWTVRNAVVLPVWNAVQPQLTVTASGGAVSAVTVGPEHGLGFDPYGTQLPLKFSGSCTATATASVNSIGTVGSIGSIAVTAGGVGCSGTTTASVNAAGTWDTAAAVNMIAGQNMTLFDGNLLKGNGGYTVWNAAGSESYGTQLGGGGGTLPGGGTYKALIANNPLGSAYPVDQFPGVDFGAKLQACLGTVSASYGGTCDARNFTGTLSMGSNLTMAAANVTVQLPCATISTANQVIVTAGTRNVALRGCALRGASNASGSLGGTVFMYSGSGAMVQVGDPAYAADTMGFHLDNVVINTTTASAATAQGLVAYRTQEMDLESLYFLGNQNQTGMTLDGTGNYTGGTFFDNAFNGFGTAVNAIGHQISNPATTDWLNASTFVRLHIDCPTSGGSPIGGTYGINLAAGDGNTFTGGDVEGCSTALHLGANAQNNTIVGLRNEGSTNQVVADAGSAYNNWMTGGTMFTGALTDNGERNSFLDTFHRSFNGLNGDWYGSQKDATVTNHYRIGIGLGNERGLLDRYQTDYGYRWTTGFSDATAGAQFYEILDELNSVYRLSIGQYNNGQSSTNDQTVVNAAGTGAVVLNGSNNSGTGGVVIGSGGPSETTVATISAAGNAQFNGTLQVGGTSTFGATPTVKNQADAEIDATLWAGLTTGQKESFIYKDWNGNSQWYMEKDASNNWMLNSATGGLDSFKAYQSANSGDTYVNASNSSGSVRVNYENGSGTGFDIYGGNSSTLYASFTGTTAIKFPGLAASSGLNCLQVDDSGFISNTGSACGSGSGSGGSAGVSSVTATSPLTSSGGATPNLSLHVADASDNGYLSSTDWSTFNGKQAALGYTPANCTAGTSGSDCLQLSSGLVPAANLPTATTIAQGAVRPDGTTITIAGGVISSTGGGSAGVSSLNSLSGAVNLVGGSGISVTPSGSSITIGNTGSGAIPPYFMVTSYGALPDMQPTAGVYTINASMTGGTSVINVSYPGGFAHPITSADVGKRGAFMNYGYAWSTTPFTTAPPYNFQICSVAGSNVTIGAVGTCASLNSITQTVSGVGIMWGTDNTTASNACVAAGLAVSGATCFFPAIPSVGNTYGFFTPGADSFGNSFYILPSSWDTGEYGTPAGGSGATFSCTPSSGKIASCSVTNAGNGLYKHSATLATTLAGGCPQGMNEGGCGGVFVTATSNSSGVITGTTVVDQGFGITQTVTGTVNALGGDGATATVSVSGGTTGAPVLDAGGDGYGAGSTLDYYLINSGGSTCNNIGGYGGSNYAGNGTATANSSGSIASFAVTHNATGCGSTPPIVVFGDFPCQQSGGTYVSPIWGQCSNMTPTVPPALPVNVLTASGVNLGGPNGASLGGVTLNNEWDTWAIDNNEPILIAGNFENNDIGNLNFNNCFMGIFGENNVNYSSIHDINSNCGFSMYTAATDVGAQFNNISMNGTVSWINGGNLNHRFDYLAGNGGFFDAESVSNILSRVQAYGGPGSLSQRFDDWFNNNFWHCEYSALSPDFENGTPGSGNGQLPACPITTNQRQTGHKFNDSRQANGMPYHGVSSIGMGIYARDNRSTGTAIFNGLDLKGGSRYVFVGSMGRLQATNFGNEVTNPILGASDPYRSATTMEAPILIDGVGGPPTMTSFSFCGSGCASNTQQGLWSLNATVGGPAGTPIQGSAKWYNVSALGVNTYIPSENYNFSVNEYFPHGTTIGSSNGITGMSIYKAYYGNAEHIAGAIQGEYNGMAFLAPDLVTHYFDITNSGATASVPFSAPSITDSGLTPGTAPICANGTAGAFTNVGCSGGSGSGGGGTVSSFAAPSGSWPAWLVPTVTNASSTPSLAVAASSTGTGNVVLANGPTFTGNTTTFANGAGAEQDVVIQPGTGADQVGAFGFNNYSGTSEWKLRKDASNSLRLTDGLNSLDREIFYQNGQTLINAGAGANAVLINGSTGSGTGGLLVESGGSSPAAVLTVTSSGNSTATGFVAGKFMMGSGTMGLGAGAAAGTGPAIACASSHICDGVSGTVTLTTGTSTTTGTLATLSFPNTHSNSANCVVTPTLSGAGLVATISWSESTTALTLTANAALTASTAYQIRYWCGGN